MRKIFLSLVWVIFIQGCGSTPLKPDQARITLRTAPEGALLSFDGQTAYAPYTFQYGNFGKIGQSSVITVTWPSGASRSINLKLIAGTDSSVVIPRPVGAPGLDADMAYALKLKEQQDRNLDSAIQAWGDAANNMGKVIGAKISK